MADYWCHLCGKRCSMMGHLRSDGTYSCQEPAKSTKLSAGYVKLTERYGEFEPETMFAVKYESDHSYRVHVAYKEALYIPKSIAERVKVYYDPT